MNNNNIQTPEQFFNAAGMFYDEMTGLQSGLDKKRSFYRSLLKPEYRSAADIGCGTGKDSIALSLEGLSVHGFDLSEEMVNSARKNAEHFRVCPKFFHAPFHANTNTYDLVTSFGNTLALIPPQNTQTLLNDIAISLNQGATFVFQILNYSPLIANRAKNLVITRGNNRYFIRFYEYNGDDMLFNILVTEGENSPKQLLTTSLYPHTEQSLRSMLVQAGFTDIFVYGGLNNEKYEEQLSSDVIGIAYKR